MHQRLLGLALALLTIHCFASAIHAEESKQKNVLLMIADDLGPQLGCYGDTFAKTPNLDRLASEGTRFANGFASVASCSPSRATILTGLSVHQNGQYGLAHAAHHQSTFEWVRSLPKVLNESGYRTGIIGKNHVLPKTVYPYGEELKSTEGTTRSPVGMSEAARGFITSEPSKPFFLVMGFTDPHRVGTTFSTDKSKNFTPAEFDAAKVPVPAFLPDTPEVREDLVGYYVSVNRLDDAVARTLKVLEDTGHGDDTLVIFLSDNGMAFPGAKTTVYDAGVRLPLIIRAPGARASVNQSIVSWLDIFPTVLEWTGAGAPKYKLDGKSLLPQLGKENDPERNVAYSSYVFHEIDMYYPMRSIRTREFRLIWNLDYESTYPSAADVGGSPSAASIVKTNKMGGRTVEAFLHRPEFELYDVKSDPDELKNLAGDASHAETVTELKKQLIDWMRQTKDPWLRGRVAGVSAAGE